MFPDFIIIGAMKCGTSSLYYYLGLHPEIGMSEIKEVDFFIAENNFAKGPDWYREQFKGDYKIFGEASPNYSKAHRFRGVPYRMFNLLPDAKLIYLVRDPIERLISHYTHNYSEGREHRSLTEVLAESNWNTNHYVMCSRYYWQLEHYLEYYSGEHILIVPSYKLKHDSSSTLQQIFQYLGVESSFHSAQYAHQLHRTDAKRRRGRISALVLDAPFIKTLKGYVPEAVKSPLKKWTRPAVTKPELTESVQTRLRDYFRPDVEALRSFSGESFSKWNL